MIDTVMHRVSAVFLSILLLSAIPLNGQKKRAAAPFVFTPQWTAQAQFAGYYVAQEKGFYEEEGIVVVIEHPNSTRTALDRIRKNQSQATTLPVAQAMEVMDSGIPLVNILQTSMNSGLMLVSRRGKDPLQQRGATASCFRAGFSQLAICMAQEKQLDYNWIEAANMLNLFVAGAIDVALCMSYNEYYQLLQTGLIDLPSEGVVCRLSQEGYNIQEDGVYMTRDAFRKDSERALKFAAASRRGWEYAAEHPDEALEIVMRYVRKHHIATNPVLQRLMLQEILRLMENEDGVRSYTLEPEMVNRCSQLLLEAGIIRNPHPIESFRP